MGVLKRDSSVKLWRIISAPIIYFFMQMTFEVVICIIVMWTEFKSIYKEFTIINDAQAVVNKLEYSLDNYSVLALFFSAIIAVLVYGYLLQKEGIIGRDKDVGIAWKENIFLYVIFGIVFSLAVSNLISAFRIDGIYGNYESGATTLLQGNIVFRLLVLGVATPIAEEVIYRGIVYNRLSEELKEYAAILVSAFAFGLFHFNLVQGIYGFVMGIVFGTAYYRTKSLRMPIVMHMMINIESVIADYYKWNEIVNNKSRFFLLVVFFEFLISAVVFYNILLKEERKIK